TAAAVVSRRAIRPLVFMALLLSAEAGAALAPTHADDAENDGGGADQQRHEGDVEELDLGLEPIDVLAQGELHLAELAADLQHLAAEIVDRLGLLGGERHIGLSPALALQLLDLRLRVLELLFELLLARLVAVIGGALDVLHHLERPDRGAAAP